MRNNVASKSLKVCLIAFAVISLGACNRKNLSPFPTISAESKANLNAPINCSTAPQDIAVLEEERASVGKQVLSGVRSILPIAAVAGILMGDYSSRIEVATGQYNADIDAKIRKIQEYCGQHQDIN